MDIVTINFGASLLASLTAVGLLLGSHGATLCGDSCRGASADPPQIRSSTIAALTG